MIQTFVDAETEHFFTHGASCRLPVEVFKRVATHLNQLQAATRISDLRLPPFNKLEKLVGDRDGHWSIRINDQWRLCFRFKHGDAWDVELVDYH